MILKSGSVGFVAKRPNSDIKNYVMDVIKLEERNNPVMVNLDFIPRKRSRYELKSMEYSIFYFLPYEKFMEVLR